MAIVVVGINHKTAPIQVRERIVFKVDEIPESLAALRRSYGVSECVIVCTCNRVEVYGEAELPFNEIRETILEFIARSRGIEREAFERFTYAYHDQESVRHLIRVAAGMDSMVLGETEVFGQLKWAYHLALKHRATGRWLNRVFQYAFASAKKIRSQTSIQRGSVTVSSVAVDLASRIFDDLSRCRVMIVGVGDTGEKAARAMILRGVRKLSVVNRSEERAEKLACKLGAIAIPFERWHDELRNVDIILFSTAAYEPLLRTGDLVDVLRMRGDRPLLIIDLAVPRNVEEGVGRLESVFLYNIDDLQSVADAALQERRKELSKCEEMVEQFVEQFIAETQRWLSRTYLRPSTATGIA